MIENRRHFRLRKQFEITWSVPEQSIQGEGRILNISISGMLFFTDKLFVADHGLTMCFSASDVPDFPPKGKLSWFKKVEKERPYYKCGVKFLNEVTQNPAWLKWMEDNISKLSEIGDNKILNYILSSDGQE